MTPSPDLLGEAMRRCPVCGQTAPEPKWFCVTRRWQQPGVPCGYSIESHDKLARDFARIERERAKGGHDER